MKLLTIVKARYIDGYKIEATFSNGVKKLLDFAPTVKKAKGVVGKLKDINYFKNFTLDPFTIDWDNEIGFDPQDLYEQGTTVGHDGSMADDEPTVMAESAAGL